MKLLYNSKTLLLALLVFSGVTARAAGDNGVAKADSGTVTKAVKKEVSRKADPDTTWKPVRRIWGYTFGDFYYDAHSDYAGRGAETNYAGVPTYRNAFQFRRIYLGYDYDITKKFTATLLLASEPNASTSAATATVNGVSGTTSVNSGDNLADNKMSFYIKLANLRVKDVWTGTDFIIGEQPTPTWNLSSEQVFNHRWIERTITDFHKLGNSFDLGAGLQGTFDPTTKNFGYNLLVGNNTQAAIGSASSPTTGFYKEFYGDIWGKFLDKKLYIDAYADYARTAQATAAIGGQSHNMLKGIIAYTTPALTLGVEAFTEKITNGVTITNGTTKTVSNANAEGISFNAYGAIVKDKLGFIARFDTYNPDSEFITGTTTYSVNTGNGVGSYTPYTKEQFYVVGLDYTPAPNIHFSPNIWFLRSHDQQLSTTSGYVNDDHTLIYRVTFFFTFGK
jgi:hypothetical protein